MDISPEIWNTQDTIHRPHGNQEEGRSKSECFGSSEKGNKILKGVNTEIKSRVEPEGEVIQRLSYLGIHPIYSHQTPALLWMPRNAC